uniref:FAD dependent oxidoreductase domain-containing protein n=1 Tax=Ditylenchus dipsaci TaxID=166011 RepID=A0A915D9Y7_9BILA
MKSRAVVCGGGLMGLSIAYHLAKRGASVMLFERECVGSHSGSRVSTGLMTASGFYSDTTSQLFARRSLEMYTKLAQRGKFRFNKCGRVYFGSSSASSIQLRRLLTRLKCTNANPELVDSQNEMHSRWPMFSSEDLKLAVYSPDDVALDVHGLCRELVEEVQELGVEIHENCGIKKVLLSDSSSVYAVDTDKGLVETSAFVNAAGIWSNMIPVKEVPEGFVRIPVHPCSYMFLSTTKLPQDHIADSTPVFIDCDNGTFISLTIPEHNLVCDWQVPAPNWDNFYSVLKRLNERCPSLGQLPHGDLISGAEMYTPDQFPVMGESWQARGYYIANGMNGNGLAMAGGLAQTLAEWILEGRPSVNVGKYDVIRFLPLHTNAQYLYERVPEVASNTFKTLHHSFQCHTARNLRMSQSTTS